MTDYKKLAEDALRDYGRFGPPQITDLARALQACAADLEAAEKKRDEAVRLVEAMGFGRTGWPEAQAWKLESDRLAAALEQATDTLARFRQAFVLMGRRQRAQEAGIAQAAAREALKTADCEPPPLTPNSPFGI